MQASEYPLARALRGEEQPTLEVHYQFDDGSRGWILLSAASLRDAAGSITGAIVTAQDIDLQKRAASLLQQSNTSLEAQAEASAHDLAKSNCNLVAEVSGRQAAESMVRQLQKMEAVGQLTGGIAHDFNNMLAVVISGLNLMQRRLARGETDVSRFVEAALDGAMRAGSLTQRLLAFSRQQTLSPVPVDTNKLLIGMEDLLHRTLGETVQVETVLAANLWLTHADPSQLENAVLNLTVNARDAMSGNGRLTIETANTRLDDAYARENDEVTAGQYVMVAVSDTGSGMSPAVMARVFDPYFTTKDTGKGTGLGLSQVYGFVKQSGGHIKLYSEVGQGTSVKVYLPRFYGEASVGARSQAVPFPEAGSRDQVILVVEDEARVREMTVASLRELGYTVIHADSAVAALRQLDEHPALSLLFTDVVMPDMNGRQLAEEATRRQPGLKVLFTTGYTQDAVVHNGVLEPGMQLLPKPFNLEQLAFKMHEVLGAG
ncbi:MAG: ATP-binding protein [Janthinobacterium lividum]